MHRSIHAYLLAAAVLVPCASPARAMERIAMRDGRVLYGELTAPLDPTSATLKVRIGRTQLLLARDQIVEIGTATPEQASFAAGREALRNGDAGGAVLQLQDAVAMAMQPERMAPEVADLLLAHGDRLLEAAHGFNADQTSATLQMLDVLDRLPRNYPRGRDVLLIAAPLRLVCGDVPGGQAALMRVAPQLLDDAAARERLGTRLQQAVQPLVDAGEIARVLPIYDQLALVDPDLASGRLTQLTMEWAWKERQAGRFEQALDLYVEYALDESPEIARDRIAVTLEEAERTCRETNDLPRAAALYQAYGLPHVPQLARERLVQIRHDQGWQHLRRNEFEAARSAFEQADTVTSGSAKMDLLQVDYRERLQAIPEGDRVRHYQLGIWALQHDLLTEARREFERAASDPVVGRNAEAYIGQIRNRQADEQLVALFHQYEAGDYTEVLNGLNLYMQEDYPIGFLKQAHQLEELTKEALRLRVAERPQQAEALLQRAQRAYYEGNYEETQTLLTTIEQHYADTVAHQRAKAFHASIRQRLALGQLEQGRAALVNPVTTDTTATSGSTPQQAATETELERLQRAMQTRTTR